MKANKFNENTIYVLQDYYGTIRIISLGFDCSLVLYSNENKFKQSAYYPCEMKELINIYGYKIIQEWN